MEYCKKDQWLMFLRFISFKNHDYGIISQIAIKTKTATLMENIICIYDLRCHEKVVKIINMVCPAKHFPIN